MSWKREEIPDHKFDFVDVEEFTDNSISRKMAYSTVFIFALKDILVYMAELASVSLLVAANKDAIFGGKFSASTDIVFSSIPQDKPVDTTQGGISSNVVISALGGPMVMFFLIIASLFASFILLAFEWKKAQKIIKSRDISYAFTSKVAYSYYTIRSYPHYCFFSQIQNSRKPVDVLAFWVFFKFKGWKRLILAEFPRQFLNAFILVDIFRSKSNKNKSFFDNVKAMFDPNGGKNIDVVIFTSLQIVTVSLWIVSFLGLVVAFIIYIPLLFNIRGNLKEYCVHKIDKRIGEILKRKTRKRVQDARRQEQEKIGGSSATLGNEPTLPSIDVDLDSNVYQKPGSYGTYQSSYQNEYTDYGSEAGSSVYQQGSSRYQVQPAYRYPDQTSNYSGYQDYKQSPIAYAPASSTYGYQSEPYSRSQQARYQYASPTQGSATGQQMRQVYPPQTRRGSESSSAPSSSGPSLSGPSKHRQ